MVLFAFMLQAIVPAGFMPAAVSSGQLIKLCPTGLSPELMSILHPQHQQLGEEHRHHGGHHQQSQHQTENMPHDKWRADCPFGAVASADLLTQSWSGFTLAVALDNAQQPHFADRFIVPQPLSAHQARAPPSKAS